MQAQSVQCCVTSPPYWGLRDYGTATWEGGNTECDHKRFNAYPTGLNGSCDAQDNGKFFKDLCPKCGANRIDSQLGLEESPEIYITRMVAVFREVWRVLKDDGVMFLNLGDNYAGSSMSGGGKESSTLVGTHHEDRNGCRFNGVKRELGGLKPKDLCMIPARVAMALQSDGWYLRSEIIWYKPNPMPESVTDRPTKSHEYIFLLTKQDRYFYDAEAIREKAETAGDTGLGFYPNRAFAMGRNPFGNELNGGRAILRPNFRNKRSVWTIATEPYDGAHFATFPEEIPKLCILAGTRAGDTVLDPFAGSGTTGKVAIELGRRAILIELSPAYVQLARERTNVTPGWF